MLFVRGGTVLTMDAKKSIIHEGGLLIEDDRIQRIGAAADLAATAGITRTIAAEGHVILPGLINAHTHVFQTLYRGLGHDLPLAEWSSRTIFPLSRWLGRPEANAAARLGCLEMLLTGTTTFVDSHYIHVEKDSFDGIAEAVVESGMRAVLGRASVDGPAVPEAFREDPLTAQRETDRAIARWHLGCSGRIRVRPEPLSERTATSEMIRALTEVSRRSGTGLNMHLAESREGVELIRRSSGRTPAEFLSHLGVLGPDVLLAHCVWLENGDLATLGQTGTKVVHNPISNQYLAAGVAPVPAMLRLGIAVALGTDGAASNNNLDMFGVIKSCGLLHKVSSLNASVIPPEVIVEMATMGGARALGLENEIGSLEPGKKADLILLSTERPAMVPLHRVPATLVYATLAAAVRTVLVDGRVVVENGRITTLDARAVMQEARSAANRIMGRDGIG